MAVHVNHAGASREPHWRFTEATLAVKGNHAGDSREPTQNGVVAVVNHEATPLHLYSLLREFSKPSESQINEAIP